MCNVEPDEYHYHESLDRTHIILSMIDDLLRDHPAIEDNEGWWDMAEKAQENLMQLYQAIGERHLL